MSAPDFKTLLEGATPGPWRWSDDWNRSMFEDEGRLIKYANLSLFGKDNTPIIPLIIDHREVEFDGNPWDLREPDRELISRCSPSTMALVLTALEVTIAWGKRNGVDNPLAKQALSLLNGTTPTDKKEEGEL